MNLNNNEKKLLAMIQNSTDPAEAAKIAFEIIMQAIATREARELAGESEVQK